MGYTPVISKILSVKLIEIYMYIYIWRKEYFAKLRKKTFWKHCPMHTGSYQALEIVCRLPEPVPCHLVHVLCLVKIRGVATTWALCGLWYCTFYTEWALSFISFISNLVQSLKLRSNLLSYKIYLQGKSWLRRTLSHKVFHFCFIILWSLWFVWIQEWIIKH